MHRVQDVAIELFEQRGYDAVTIEQIADAAEFSPSTIYRYFGTKEGLVIADEYDDLVLALASQAVQSHDPYTAAERALTVIAPEHFGAGLAMSRRRVLLWTTVPAVQAATVTTVNRLIRQYAEILHTAQPSAYSVEDAHIVATSVVWALVAAIEQWAHAGADDDLLARMLRAVRLIRPAPPAQ